MILARVQTVHTDVDIWALALSCDDPSFFLKSTMYVIHNVCIFTYLVTNSYKSEAAKKPGIYLDIYIYL